MNVFPHLEIRYFGFKFPLVMMEMREVGLRWKRMLIDHEFLYSKQLIKNIVLIFN